jgi:predicted TIM-barrel fold metal-dependent hydrolase
MQIFTRCAAAMVLIAAGLLLVPAANAEVQSPSPGAQSPSPGATDQPSNIPDQKIDAAAAAIQQVASVKQDYKQRIAAAAPADKERILNEAIGALEKAVTDQGLSVEEYDSILKVAENDPKVLEKIRQRLRAPAD